MKKVCFSCLDTTAAGKSVSRDRKMSRLTLKTRVISILWSVSMLVTVFPITWAQAIEIEGVTQFEPETQQLAFSFGWQHTQLHDVVPPGVCSPQSQTLLNTPVHRIKTVKESEITNPRYNS